MALALNAKTDFLAGSQSDGNTSVADADCYYEHYFYVTVNSGSGTMTVQVSADNSHWHDAADSISATGLIIITGAYPYMRFNIASSSSLNADVQLVQYASHPTRAR